MRHTDDRATPASLPLFRAIGAPREQPTVPERPVLEAHLARARYGRFTLTEAIRPGWQLDIVPRAGYRHDSYVDPRSGARLPAVVAAVSAENLFATFLELLEPLGDTCDVVLESSHDAATGQRELARDGVERLVLESLLWDFEDLLLNDGCTGIAVMHPEQPLEVQLDEHKLIVVYAAARGPFEQVLRARGLQRDDRLRLLSQGEHLHTSHARHARQFAELAGRLDAR